MLPRSEMRRGRSLKADLQRLCFHELERQTSYPQVGTESAKETAIMSDATRTSLEPESMVASYRISHSLACGGMAEVFEAEHAVLPRRVALKVMHPELLRKQDMDTRFLREACILESFTHPGGVRVFECGVLPDGRPWMAMELVRGHAMTKEMHKPMAPAAVVSILSSVLEVLAAAHAVGLIHRDLKPDNLLLSDDPDGYPVRVIDWGLARLESFTRLTQDGTAAGTPLYMAPEQTQGKPLDGRCDVYALGVVAYEALSGVPPFDGQNLVEIVVRQVTTEPQPLHQLRPDIPKSLSDLVTLMLTRDPARRPTATELMPLLAAVAEELSPLPPRHASEDEPIVEVSFGEAADELDLDIDVELGELSETPTAPIYTRVATSSGQRAETAAPAPSEPVIELTQPVAPPPVPPLDQVARSRARTMGERELATHAQAAKAAAYEVVDELAAAADGAARAEREDVVDKVICSPSIPATRIPATRIPATGLPAPRLTPTSLSRHSAAALLAAANSLEDDGYDDSFDDPLNDNDESTGVPLRDQLATAPRMHWTPEPVRLETLGLARVPRRRRRCEITPRGPSDQIAGEMMAGEMMAVVGNRRS